MAKKSKRRRQKGKASKTAPADYSIDRYGPLILERRGRFLSLRSEWDPKEFEEYIARVKANREPFREEIKVEIAELLALIERYNPLELLSVIALKTTLQIRKTTRRRPTKERNRTSNML